MRKPTFLKKDLIMAIPFICIKVIKYNQKTLERYVDKVIYKNMSKCCYNF